MTKTISMQFGPKMEKIWLDMFDKVLSSCHYCACLFTSLFYIAMSTRVHTHTHTIVMTSLLLGCRTLERDAFNFLQLCIIFCCFQTRIHFLKCRNNIKIHDAVLNKHFGKLTK